LQYGTDKAKLNIYIYLHKDNKDCGIDSEICKDCKEHCKGQYVNKPAIDMAECERFLTRPIEDWGDNIALYAVLIGHLLGKLPLAQEQMRVWLKNQELKRISNVLDQIYQHNKHNLDVLDQEADLEGLLKALPNEYSKRWLMKELIQKELEIFKRVLTEAKDISANNRVCLAAHMPSDIDNDFVISLLSDKSKQVASIAIDRLKGHKELRDKIIPLLSSKKKSTRENAELLLQYYDGNSALLDAVANYKQAAGGIIKALAWAEPDGWVVVHERDSGKPADIAAVRYYVYQYISPWQMASPEHTKDIAAGLNAEDLHTLADQIYSYWIAAGATPKLRGAMQLYATHADDEAVLTLHKQIVQWAEHGRGALAVDGVKAMVLSGRDIVLRQLSALVHKFKTKQVGRAATEAFALAAEIMGLTADQLADNVVSMQPLSEYNKRELKAALSMQAARLEDVLASGRLWTIKAWKDLFIDKPIMQSFAIGLIWGFYRDAKLVKAFRYMADGSINTQADASISFADYVDANIGLIHPLELTADEIAAWTAQLEDYEIAQPILQLARPVFRLGDLTTHMAERTVTEFAYFDGKKFASKLNWTKGAVQNAKFDEQSKDFGGIRATIKHSPILISQAFDPDATLGLLIFTNDSGNMMLKDVPVKVFSEVLYNLSSISRK
jgi:hypothetical protein